MKKEYEVRSYFTSYYSKCVEAENEDEAAEKALNDDSIKWELSDHSWENFEIDVFDAEWPDEDNEYAYR